MSTYYPGNDVELGTFGEPGRTLVLCRRDRARHTYMVGGTRTGKTKLMEGMCRQDLLQWPKFRCPMVVVDPHDTLFDGLMEYAAAADLREWPIIPFDLRRRDFVVSYDLLKKRKGVRPEVVCRSFAEAIIHAWGQSNTHDTPRLASTLLAALMTVYEKECSLSEALAIITDPELRRLLSADLEHQASRATLLNAQALGEKGFQETMQSMMYRVNAFLSTQVIEATLCSRTGQSLDLEEVLQKGKILLVCLSTAGGNIATEDAWALGSIILTDLWSAAKRRGKAEEGRRAPCYVYVDEFQNFLTPDIAVGLTEASGFGLHLTLAHQYPKQLPDRAGELGNMILNSVLATAKNKVVFQVEHPDDLDLLANVMGRQMVDLDKVKYEISTTKVLSYKLAYLPAFSESTTEGEAHSEQRGETRSTGRSLTNNWSDGATLSANASVTDGQGESHGSGQTDTNGTTQSETDSVSRSRQKANSTSDATSDSRDANWSTTHGKTKGESSRDAESRSESLAFGPLSEKLQEQLGEYKEGELDRRGQAEDFERRWPKEYTLTRGRSSDKSVTSGEQASDSVGGAASHGSSHVESIAAAETDTASKSKGLAQSRTRATSETSEKSRTLTRTQGSGASLSHSKGGSESESEAFSEQYQEGVTNSLSRTQGVSWHPTLIPVLGREPSSRVLETKDEQLYRITQFIDAQPDRHCLVRLASDRTAAKLFTRTVDRPKTTKGQAEKWTVRRLERLPFVLGLDQAVADINARRRELKARLLAKMGTGEPSGSRRKVMPPPGSATASPDGPKP
jgi:hypothetical protein